MRRNRSQQSRDQRRTTRRAYCHGSQEKESLCNKKLTAPNSTGSVNTKRCSLDICVSGFSGMVGAEARCGSKNEWVVGTWSLGVHRTQGEEKTTSYRKSNRENYCGVDQHTGDAEGEN